MIELTEDARELQLDQLEQEARNNLERTAPFFFKGQWHNLPVFKVEIGFPRYRMENGRTRRKQIEFRVKNPDRVADLDDPSSKIAQEIQGQILGEMANEEGLLDLLRQGQSDPILLSHQGYAVNGNRRLAAMRYLHDNPSKKNEAVDFSFVDVARLPELDEKEIRRIEQRLQMSKDGKADYNWVDELLTIRENISDFGMSESELARDMNKKTPTIQRLLLMMNLIDMYLDRNNLRGMYFEVEADEQAFKTLADGHKKYSQDTRLQNLLLDMAFPVILSNEAGESKHKRISKIAENPDAVLKNYERLTGEIAGDSEQSGTGPMDDILEDVPVKKIPLDNSSSAVVQQAIREYDKEQEFADAANGPAESVSQAATLLRGIRLTSDTSKTAQLRGQLKAISKLVDELLKKIDDLGSL